RPAPPGKPTNAMLSYVAKKIFGTKNARVIKAMRPAIARIAALEEGLQAKSDDELRAITPALKARLAKGETLDDILPEAFAARRDSEWMGRIYKYLGLSVGIIVHGLNDWERQANYRCDVTYGTNSEFGFDYLRDNMKDSIERYVQRDPFFAIVDEVDSILIDEARTPLIISGPAEDSADLYYRVNMIIPSLKKDVDYSLDEK